MEKGVSALRFLDEQTVRELADVVSGIDALRAALVDGIVDPEHDSPRLFSEAPAGEFLIMPAVGTQYCGVKTLTIAPANPAAGRPRVQGVYTLFRNDGLAPVALMDAAELTLIRTPAVTTLAAVELLRAQGRQVVDDAVIIGTGPQADRHARALTRLVRPGRLRILGRRPEAAAALVASLLTDGIEASVATASELPSTDLIVCATSSTTPVLDDADVRSDAIVLAVGAHGLDARELPTGLVRRSDVVVEARGSAMRESGNLIPARSVEEWADQPLWNLRELVTGAAILRGDRPVVYSAVGMAWEDLIIATDIHHRSATSTHTP